MCLLCVMMFAMWRAVIAFAWYGKTYLVALVPLFLVKFWKRIAHWLVIFCTVAEDVNGKVDCMTERKFVSNAFSCQ